MHHPETCTPCLSHPVYVCVCDSDGHGGDGCVSVHDNGSDNSVCPLLPWLSASPEVGMECDGVRLTESRADQHSLCVVGKVEDGDGGVVPGDGGVVPGEGVEDTA